MVLFVAIAPVLSSNDASGGQAETSVLDQVKLQSAIEQKIKNSFQTTGYASDVAVSLQNCELTIDIKYNRPCRPLSMKWLIHERDVVDLMHVAVDGIDAVSGTAGDFSVVAEMSSQYVNSIKDLDTEIDRIMASGSSSSIGHEDQISELTEQALSRAGIRDRQEFTQCGAVDTVSPMHAFAVLVDTKINAEAIKDELSTYKKKFCPSKLSIK